MKRLPPQLRSRSLWAALLAIALIAVVTSAYDWPQFGFTARRDSNNTQESVINAANVGTLQRFLSVTLPGIADGAPAYQSAVATASGTRNLLFLTTKDGRILAVDGLTGATIWSHQYGPNGCLINHGSVPCYTTSSPAIDPNRQYVYSYGLDGYVHKYQVGDGLEIKSGGWPELASLKAYDEKGSSALSAVTAANGNRYLYVTNGGYPGDGGDYQGHVTAINLADGSQRVFNTLCSNQAVHFTAPGLGSDCASVNAAIWARAGVVYDSATNKIYMATGNGTFDPTQHNWGDSVFALNPDGTGANGNPLDSYTPTNFQQLQNTDTDIGSTAPAVLPNASKYPHLAVQGGKDGVLRLINLDNLSGHAAPGFTGGEVFSMTVPQGNEILTTPAVWVNPADASTWVFVANDNGLAGLKLSVDGSGNPRLVSQWQVANGGTSPIVANGVLYYVVSNNIWALDPVSHAQLWHNTQLGPTHWQSPIVADGVLYVTDGNGGLSGYAPNGQAPTPTPIGNATATPSRTPAPSTPTPTAGAPTATRTPTAGGQTVTLTAQVAASADDANQDGSALDLTSGTLWLGNGASTTSSYAGLRFTNLAVPSGATITSARLQVYSSQTQWHTLDLSLAAEAAGNSAAFSASSPPGQRTRTGQAVAHHSNTSWQANTWYSLDEMAPVIQAVVGRPDWQQGNSLSVIVTGIGGAWGRKFILSDDGSPANAPRLIITYTTAGGSTATPAPTASGKSQTITAQVAASADDANQDGSALDLTSGTLWLGNGASTTSSYAGLRFTNLAVPSGATITSARLQVYSSQTQWHTLDLSLAAEAAGNSAAFSASSPPGQRTRTGQAVAHHSNTSWQANTWYSLDEMAPVIQAVVGRPDWQQGNSLSVIVTGIGGAWGRKFILSDDGSPANAPRLIITYTY